MDNIKSSTSYMGLGAKYNHLNDIDYFGNNMLHLAAELSPYKQLSRVSGAALQMQRELQWFKEVEKFIPPKHRESRNNNGKTPQALFTEEHKDLVKEGEKWMKDTAQSCMLVATLIATFTFAAAFTLPGGNNNDTGIPIFLHTTTFLVFIISDALSLFSSSTSVLIFSGILTVTICRTRFPRIIAQEIDNWSCHPILLSSNYDGSLWCNPFPCSSSSSSMGSHSNNFAWQCPSLFALPQFPLLVDMVVSTYGSGIFGLGK